MTRYLRQSFLLCFHFTRSPLNTTVIHKGRHRGRGLLLVLCILQNQEMMMFYKTLKSLFFAFWNARKTRFCSALIMGDGSAKPLSSFFPHNCCCLAFVAFWIHFCYASYKLEDNILCSVLSITPAQLCEFYREKYKNIDILCWHSTFSCTLTCKESTKTTKTHLIISGKIVSNLQYLDFCNYQANLSVIMLLQPQTPCSIMCKQWCQPCKGRAVWPF